jgi:hypothetical protein
MALESVPMAAITARVTTARVSAYSDIVCPCSRLRVRKMWVGLSIVASLFGKGTRWTRGLDPGPTENV